jgi:hypothetical protein
MSRIWSCKLMARAAAGVLMSVLCLTAPAALATLASAAEPPPLGGALTPVLSVHGETVQWTPIGTETSYEIAISTAPRGVAGRTTQYLTVPRDASEPQSYTLTLQPGQTAYVGVSADKGLTWSAEEATVTAETTPVIVEEIPVKVIPVKVEEAPVTVPTQPAAPVLSVSGDTISWTAMPGATQYTLATILNSTTAPSTTYTVIDGTSYTPPVRPGQTVSYGLSATVPGTAPWAQQVTIVYPPTPTGGSGGESTGGTTGESGGGTTGESTGATKGKIIGTNDGAGWGEAPAKTIIAGHITWNRVEIGAQWNTVPASLSDGFKILAIVGNLADGTPLSQSEPSKWGAEVVSQIQANPGISIAEAGNEMYFKGGVANPVQYGEMYLAAIDAMKAADIHIPLLFNMWGDYSSPSGYSSDSSGGGWLREAVDGVPGLAAAILANGLSTHPYGSLGENYDDEAGVSAVAAQESVAQSVLGSIPPFYITEFGYDMSKCGAFDGACSEQEQATKMRAAYEVFLSDPHVAGIWWFESHDDGEGEFGFMNGNNTTRPSFDVLSSIAQEQGQ